MQLMLLEQQNEKRIMMARQEPADQQLSRTILPIRRRKHREVPGLLIPELRETLPLPVGSAHSDIEAKTSKSTEWFHGVT